MRFRNCFFSIAKKALQKQFKTIARHEVMWHMMEQYPESRLGRLTKVVLVFLSLALVSLSLIMKFSLPLMITFAENSLVTSSLSDFFY